MTVNFAGTTLNVQKIVTLHSFTITLYIVFAYIIRIMYDIICLKVYLFLHASINSFIKLSNYQLSQISLSLSNSGSYPFNIIN